MLTFRSYLKVRGSDVRFLPIEHEESRRLIKPQAKFFSGAITLHDDKEMFFGFEMAEFEIWRTFITALLRWQSDGQAQVNFSYNRYEMVWRPVGADRLEFVLHHPEQESVVKMFPRAEFFNTVVDGLIFFFDKVVEYGNRVERNHRTVQFLHEIRGTL